MIATYKKFPMLSNSDFKTMTKAYKIILYIEKKIWLKEEKLMP